MKYLFRKSFIHVLGFIWMPSDVLCAQSQSLDKYAIENMRGPGDKITRGSVYSWLTSNAGDFSHIVDFYASIEDGNDTVEIQWQNEENEFKYIDCFAECDS